MSELFAILDKSWAASQPKLTGLFTTQTFQGLVKEETPEVWAELVQRYGPGGRGSGNYYSPANILFNYLNRKTRENNIIRHGLVPSLKGWGSGMVTQWELVGERALPPTEEDIDLVEGRQRLRSHLVRERALGMRKRLLRHRLDQKQVLSCDICETTASDVNEDIRDAAFEAHHDTAPLSSGERKTALKDMALICACCHRLIHRLVQAQGRWFTVEEARQPLGFKG